MRGIGRTAGVVIGALCLLISAQPAAAATRVKRIWPREFFDVDVSQSSFRSPESIGSVAGSAEFHAPLILPPGSRITKVVAWSNGTGQTARNGWILRYGSSLTGTFVASGADSVVVSALTPNGNEWSLYPTPDGIGTVQKGFRYDVMLYVAGADSRVWAVDVTYSTP